jgi:hypothetical protein
MTNHDRFASVFSNRAGRTFTTAEIREIMLANTDIEDGSILPNDHGNGNKGQCDCVGTARQIFDRIGHGMYRVRNFVTTIRHASPATAMAHPRQAPVKSLVSPKPMIKHTHAVPPIGELWYSRDAAAWQCALDRYWSFVQPRNLALERAMESLNRNRIHAMTSDEWYAFLHDEYFRWKYTEAKRYATTTDALRRKAGNPAGRLTLDRVRDQILVINPLNVVSSIDLASQIPGLGIAGASGLLALLYPDFFGTVDQFVVKALRQVPNLPEADVVVRMNPTGLTASDGDILVKIMRRQAATLTTELAVRWRPRDVDKVLWTYGRD